MSLDFYLQEREETRRECVCVECGNRHQGDPVNATLFSRNITHNLNRMFSEAGAYEILWRGDGLVAGAVVDRLIAAQQVMRDDPERFRKFDAPNGWGKYEHAMDFLAEVIAACREHPEGVISCSR